jgi:hypothetical protein
MLVTYSLEFCYGDVLDIDAITRLDRKWIDPSKCGAVCVCFATAYKKQACNDAAEEIRGGFHFQHLKCKVVKKSCHT